MAEIKEFKPKLKVDPDMLRAAEDCVARIKAGELVGLGIVMIDRDRFNASHCWGGDCPRNAIIGGLFMLMNRIMGNLQEQWAEPYKIEEPGAPLAEMSIADLPDGDDA